MDRYDKLVRDDIPEIIRNDGDEPITHVATGEAYRERLHDKLDEEVSEFHADPGVDELADLYEVLDALRTCYDVTESELAERRAEKADERGRFVDGVVLEGVERQ